MSSHNHSHWAKQADAIQRSTSDTYSKYHDQDREPTPDETVRDRLLGVVVGKENRRQRVVCVRPGMPLYDGDTIISGAYRLTVTQGVPKDAKIVNVFSDPLRYPLCVHVVFEHESFEPVYEGAEIPHWSPSYTMEVQWDTPEVQSDVALTYPE